MPIETETKFKVSGPQANAVRKRLRTLGAVFISKNLEQDKYFRPKGFKVRATVIRLRVKGGKHGIFTVKYPKKGAKGEVYKVVHEIEARVDNAAAFPDILNSLGFGQFFIKEKVRETYRWKAAEILIDRLPYLGYYIEIEGDKKRIKEIAGLLGLDMSLATSKTYKRLFDSYRMSHRNVGADIVFGKRRTWKK
ncbi:MAG: class IV adenylate cyclase [Candidatus Omnitrophota bacterium]